MSDHGQIQGVEDLHRLLQKTDTWEPPKTLELFLKLTGMVISTSKYTDKFMDGKPETLNDLRAFVRVKANRIASHPDLEECLDAAAYSYMVFHVLATKAGLTIDDLDPFRPNRIIKHYPNSMEGFERKEAEFRSVDELRKIPFIASWLEEGEREAYGVTLAVSDRKSKQPLLMAQIDADDKKEDWVIGYLDNDRYLDDLPDWRGK